MKNYFEETDEQSDHDILLQVRLLLCNHLKHHEKWEKVLIAIATALTIALLIKSFGI